MSGPARPRRLRGEGDPPGLPPARRPLTPSQQERIKLRSDFLNRLAVNFLSYAAITPAGFLLLDDDIHAPTLAAVSAGFAFAAAILYYFAYRVLKGLD